MRHKGTKIMIWSRQMRICSKFTAAYLLLCILFLSGCADKKGQSEPDGGGARVENNGDDTLRLKLPDIPITISSQEESIRYLAEHYWDLYDFTDTVRISRPEITEQSLVDYLGFLNEVDNRNVSANSLKKLVREMGQEATVYEWFREKLEHYLYDPNSPIRNDEFYMDILEEELSAGRLAEIQLQRSKYQLKMLRKNCVGMKAADFKFRLPSGKKNSLWNLKSELTLLLLYNPECANCQKTIEILGSSPVLAKVFEESDKVNSPLFTVLSVSVEGSEEEWDNHLSLLPLNWLNGYDEHEVINTKELYDLRSVPSIYLLDKNKKVLLKDVNAPDVLEYLANML